MNHRNSGFLRIIVILIVIVGLLLFSGIDLRENIDNENVQNTLIYIQSEAFDIYQTYLNDFVDSFVITPAKSFWHYLDLYVINAITDFLQSIYSGYGINQ